MRRAALSAARLVLLGGPTALAFFSGGYFAQARAWAGVGAWLLVAVAALTCGRLLPPGRGARLALGGLAALAAWTLLSMLWAPIAGNAYHAGQIVVLYLGGLLAAALLLQGDRGQRMVVPVLAGGALIVISYGISERLFPGVLTFARSASAEGRLEQPLTYWNAIGELAAIGLVLCAALAGDTSRAVWLQAVAAAAVAPLGMGLYLSFSRGALFACVTGLVALVAAAPRREQLWATLRCVLTAALAVLACASFRGLTALAGPTATRERQGAIALALLVVVMVVAAVAQWLLARRERIGELGLPRRTPLLATAAICAGLALAIVVGAKETSGSASLSGGTGRLATLQSNRYDYWAVALRAFAQEPLHGVGAGAWSVYWRRWRNVDEFAQDAHSLPLQTLAELGLIGLALLAAFLAGVAVAASRALRATPLAAGPIAGLAAYLAHSPLDWDWQMPAVTLIAIVLAGALLGAGALTGPRRSAAPHD